ncbi:MAG: Zn-ribbon domain-containing protein [Halobacteriales archaeon]|nr:Zn-ribbon domain-containing protein [Halobacteriales archaeon]
MELTAPQVRGVNIGSIVVAALAILLALFVMTGSDQAGTRLLLLVVLAVLLVAQVWLLLQARRATQQAQEGEPAAASAEVGPAAEPSLEEPAKIIIKCKQCATVFPVTDDGSRPLVAACPSCGKSGTIKVKADVA